MSIQEAILLEKSLQRTRVSLESLVKQLLEILGGVLLLAIGAHAKFILPFTPVPFTLQTLFLTYLILLLKKRAWRPVAIYIALGLIGLPVFAYGGGLWYVLSPTFGYILGFLAASFVVGYYVSPIVYPRKLVIGSVMIQLIIYLLGFLWLASYLIISTGQTPVNSILTAILMGVVPFIPWDLLKALIAAGIFYATNRIISMIGYGKQYFPKQ